MNDVAIAERPKGRSIQPLRTLWPFIRPYRMTLVAALFALLLAAAALLGLPIALRFLIDQGFLVSGSSPTFAMLCSSASFEWMRHSSKSPVPAKCCRD